MTLNSNFALKSVSGLATDVLASPALGHTYIHKSFIKTMAERIEFTNENVNKTVNLSINQSIKQSVSQTKLFENLQSYPYTVSDKNVSKNGGIRFMQIFAGVRWRRGVK